RRRHGSSSCGSDTAKLPKSPQRVRQAHGSGGGGEGHLDAVVVGQVRHVTVGEPDAHLEDHACGRLQTRPNEDLVDGPDRRVVRVEGGLGVTGEDVPKTGGGGEVPQQRIVAGDVEVAHYDHGLRLVDPAQGRGELAQFRLLRLRVRV